jgi:hypothetical protein
MKGIETWFWLAWSRGAAETLAPSALFAEEPAVDEPWPGVEAAVDVGGTVGGELGWRWLSTSGLGAAARRDGPSWCSITVGDDNERGEIDQQTQWSAALSNGSTSRLTPTMYNGNSRHTPFKIFMSTSLPASIAQGLANAASKHCDSFCATEKISHFKNLFFNLQRALATVHQCSGQRVLLV